MKLHIVSDLHLEFGLMDLPSTDAEVIVLAGDIGPQDQGLRHMVMGTRGKSLVYVAGNHEFYDSNIQVVTQDLRRVAQGNAHFLENNTVVINGVRFLGCTLWTDFRIFGEENQIAAMSESGRRVNDFQWISIGVGDAKTTFRPSHALDLHEGSRVWLEAQLDIPHDGPTVVVTHHAPHPLSLSPRYADKPTSAAYVSDLSALMGKAQLWIHGHTHVSLDYEVNGTRVVCNPRGYSQAYGRNQNPDFQPGLVVEI